MAAPFAAIGGMMGSGPTSQIANGFRQKEANQKNWEHDKEMFRMQLAAASSAHQTQVADMRAAGLNPILSANMSGASTPSGTAHPGLPIWSSDKMQGLSQSAQAVAKLKQDQKTVDANAHLAETSAATQQSQQQKNVADAEKAQADKTKAQAETARTVEEIGLKKTENTIRRMDEMERKWQQPAAQEESGAAHLRGKMQNNNFIQSLHQLKSLLNPLDYFKAIKGNK